MCPESGLEILKRSYVSVESACDRSSSVVVEKITSLLETDCGLLCPVTPDSSTEPQQAWGPLNARTWKDELKSWMLHGCRSSRAGFCHDICPTEDYPRLPARGLNRDYFKKMMENLQLCALDSGARRKPESQNPLNISFFYVILITNVDGSEGPSHVKEYRKWQHVVVSTCSCCTAHISNTHSVLCLGSCINTNSSVLTHKDVFSAFCQVFFSLTRHVWAVARIIILPHFQPFKFLVNLNLNWN